MNNLKETQLSLIDEADIIDVDVMVVTDPVINVKRTISVIYSRDSVASTCTAALLKNILECEQSPVVKETYDVEFVEIGSFTGYEVSDAYLWIGMGKVTPDIHPTSLSKFNSAQHSLYDQLVVSLFDEMSTTFQDAIQDVRDEVKYMFTGSDFAYKTVNQFSRLIPELEFSNIFHIAKNIANTDNAIDGFLSTTSQSNELLVGWVFMNKSLQAIGQPHTVISSEWTAEETIETYLRERSRFKDIIDSSVSEVLEINGGYKRVMRTSIPDGFWMARRILALAGVLHHNVRLVETGYHVETNLPSSIAKTFKIGTTRSTALH